LCKERSDGKMGAEDVKGKSHQIMAYILDSGK
jgi:hypothetical protein